MKNQNFIVKVTVGGATASKTWNTESELTLGHPMRWVLERSSKGVQVRNVEDGSVREFTEAQLAKSGELELPESDARLRSAFKVELMALDLLPPAYETHGPDHNKSGEELRIYETKGLWTTRDEVFADSFTSHVEGKPVFAIDRQSGSALRVRSFRDGIQVGGVALAKGKSRDLELADLAGNEIQHGEFKWKFERLKSVAAPKMDALVEADEAQFKTTLKRSMAFVAVCALISLFIPKGEETVAPQPTRFVFKKTVKGYMTSAAKGDRSARDFSQGQNRSAAKPRGSDKPVSGEKVQKARKGSELAQQKKPAPAAKPVAKAAAQKPVQAKSAPAKMVAKAAPQKPHMKPKTVARPTVVSQNAPKAAPIAPRGRVLPTAGKPVAKAQPAKPKPDALANSAISKLLGSSALKSATAGAASGGVSRMKVGAGNEAGELGELARGRSALDETAGVAGGDGVGARRIEVTGSGGGSGFRGGEGIGYGRGSHAAVNGQGKSFVSLDTSASDVAEGLTKDQVGRVIHKHMSEIRYCYESAMIRTPDVEGKLAVNFVIGGNGTVKRAGVGQSSHGDSKLDNCVMDRLVRWKFPQPRGGVDVAVNYPFVFKTLGR
jgi:TonB family protein